MNAIKIGRKKYIIQKGDYILYNGACYQFCAGDGRTLKAEKWNLYNSLVIPKIVLSKINITEMGKKEVILSGIECTKYYF